MASVDKTSMMRRSSQLELMPAACKAAMDPAHGIAGSSVVTTMARNGTEFGIRVSGLGDRWFTGPAQVPRGLYFAGLPWIHNAKPGLLFGVGEDAAFIAAHIEARNNESDLKLGHSHSSGGERDQRVK